MHIQKKVKVNPVGVFTETGLQLLKQQPFTEEPQPNVAEARSILINPVISQENKIL